MKAPQIVSSALAILALMGWLALQPAPIASAIAQTSETAEASTETQAEAPTLLTEPELETLVARIALYPDDLVAVIVSASLEPLQIVQAQRFLESKKTKPDLKPDSDWDGSIVSLLNYPEIVKMMNDDLDWVEQLGAAAANQEQDLLAAIQQLRDQAQASGILKGNDKVVVEKANDKVIIKSKDPEVVYVPSYDPQILTDPGYVVSDAAPPVYYSDPYPAYYYPGASYWAGAVTGAVWGSVVDWDDGHFWGGNVDIDDLDIDINNVDINKIRNDFRSGKYKDSFNRDNFKNRLEGDNRNRVDRKARDARQRTANANRPQERRDVRKSVESGLKKQGQAGDRARQGQQAGQRQASDRQRAQQAGDRKPARQTAAKRQDRPAASQAKRPSQKSARKTSGPKPGNRVDNRPRNVSAMGDYGRGQSARNHSNRGHASRGGRSRPSGGGGGRRRR